MKNSRIFSYALTIVLIGIGSWLFLNRQDVIDWWRLRNYEPTAEISRLATDASLSDEGRRLFYVHAPELLNKNSFQGKCTTDEETIVLGCYITHNKIYVFDVEDDRLEGVEEVTAAHEMLHAVYDRLSEDEKEEIDTALLEFYENLDDGRLRETVESYRTRDSSVVPNELHSIIATEVRDLPTILEDHYSQYFLDRQSVVAIAEAYEAEFIQLETQIDTFDTQLKELNAQIEQSQTDIDFLNSALIAEQAQLEALSGNPQTYNAAVPGFNLKVRQFNTKIAELRALIDQYNLLVEERNAIAVEEQELVEAIDTRINEL